MFMRKPYPDRCPNGLPFFTQKGHESCITDLRWYRVKYLKEYSAKVLTLIPDIPKDVCKKLINKEIPPHV